MALCLLFREKHLRKTHTPLERTLLQERRLGRALLLPCSSCALTHSQVSLYCWATSIAPIWLAHLSMTIHNWVHAT